jgi:DnaK suppressor protein
METNMPTGKSKLDADFVEKQKHSLMRLRASLTRSAQAAESDEAAVNAEANMAEESEDDAQRLAALELNGNLVVRDIARLERVDRALAKIANGTYGLSEVSGKPIPRERLEAVPEAIGTLSEEESREGRKTT